MRFTVTFFCALTIGALAGVCDAGISQTNSPCRATADTVSAFTSRVIEAFFAQANGAQLWAVGDDGAILNHARNTGLWHVNSSDTLRDLYSVYATDDGSDVWAVGRSETVLHYASATGYWFREFGVEYDNETNAPASSKDLTAVYGSRDGSEVWAVGDRGTILHFSTTAKKWKVVPSATRSHLRSVFGTANGQEFWAAGWNGTILHFTKASQQWQKQASGTTVPLRFVTGKSDGADVWAIGDKGTVLHLSKAAGVWHHEPISTTANLVSLSGDAEQSQLIATAANGLQFRYSATSRKWEPLPSDPASSATCVKRAVIAVAASADGSGYWSSEGSGNVVRFSRNSGSSEIEISPNENWTNIDFDTGVALHDGSQVWLAGTDSPILHYSKDQGVWNSEAMSAETDAATLFANPEGTKVWYLGDDLYTPKEDTGQWVKTGLDSQASIADLSERDIFRLLAGRQWYGRGNNAAVSHYLANESRWVETTPFPNFGVFRITSTPDGSQVWAVDLGSPGVAHFQAKDNRWNLQPIAGRHVRAIFVTNDGTAGWGVGPSGEIVQLVSGTWVERKSGTLGDLAAISGNHDASELWAAGAKGLILHYTAPSGEWKVENGPFLVHSTVATPIR